MRAIYKQILEQVNFQTIKLPINSKIIFVANQREQVCIWYECLNSEDVKTEHDIYIFGTGHEMPFGLKLKHLGSVLLMDGALVWHVYERVG